MTTETIGEIKIPSFMEFMLSESLQHYAKACINEGEGTAAGGDASGAIGGDAGADMSPGPEIATDGDAQFMHGGKPVVTTDVLGKFDKKKGCMCKGDFHLPCVFPLLRRWPMLGTAKKKKKKDKKQKVKVITSYADLTEDEKTQLKSVLVLNLPHDKIETILDGTAIENQRYNKVQLLKYVTDDNVEYIGLFSEFPRECLAMAALKFEQFSDNDCFIAEIQSFKKGYGKELILKLLKYQKRLWLTANPDGGESLLKFYRDSAFNFKEYVLNNAAMMYGKPLHVFYTAECDENALLKHVGSWFHAPAKEKVKIWVDDIRPTPDGYMNFTSVNSFIDWFNENGADSIEVLDLDHDAGEFHDDGGDYIRILDFLEFNDVKDLVVRIHSDNPVGRQNMQRIIKKNGWKEVYSLIESKNKITKRPDIITQKKQSLKVTTTDKAKKIDRQTAVQKDQTTPSKIPQVASKTVVMPKVIAKQLRSKESRMASKSTTKQQSLNDFKKPVLAVKAITFPKDEVNRELKERDLLVTTRVDAEYDKFQIGDIVRAPWKDLYKVIGRRNISDVIQHPYFRELTDKQVKVLREYDKIAVLMLSKQKRIDETNYEVMHSNSPDKELLLDIMALNKQIEMTVPERYRSFFILEVHTYDELVSAIGMQETRVFTPDHRWYLVASLSKKFCDLAKAKAQSVGMPTRVQRMKVKEIRKQAAFVFAALPDALVQIAEDPVYEDRTNDFRASFKEVQTPHSTTIRRFGPGQDTFIYQVDVKLA